jgi:hypothetical protein
MPSWVDWPPGTKVVCINDDLVRPDTGEPAPVKRGEVYTVRCIRMGNHPSLADVVMVSLMKFAPEDGFPACVFERLRGVEAGMAILEKLRKGGGMTRTIEGPRRKVGEPA